MSLPIPLDGLVIVVLTVSGLFAAVYLLVRLTEAARSLRDCLRGRYADEHWQPSAVDLLGVPLWLAVEILCLLLALGFTLFAVITAYQVARGVRDWWHAGSPPDGR